MLSEKGDPKNIIVQKLLRNLEEGLLAKKMTELLKPDEEKNFGHFGNFAKMKNYGFWWKRNYLRPIPLNSNSKKIGIDGKISYHKMLVAEKSILIYF